MSIRLLRYWLDRLFRRPADNGADGARGARDIDLGNAADDSRGDLLLVGSFYASATSTLVLLAALIAVSTLPLGRDVGGETGALGRLDGRAYTQIAHFGYWYRPDRASYVAYFPAYPLLGRTVAALIGVRHETALLLVSWFCFVGAFGLTTLYVSQQTVDEPRGRLDWTLLAMGLWPTTLYFRMAYTESLFLFLILLAMHGMQRRWPAVCLAVIVGAATAARPTGIALVPVFAWHLWQTSAGARPFLPRAALLCPLACWGLLSYMLYLHVEFGDALAFAHTQRNWVIRPTPAADKLLSLLTLEPIWSPYLPGSATYWAEQARGESAVHVPFVNDRMMNPVLFMAVVAAVALGAWKRWLDSRELLLSAGLLLIPYSTMAYDNMMLSQPRFASVVFPAYLVMGHVLSRIPGSMAALLSAMSAALLVTYTVIYAAGYGLDYRILY